ncbi:MAG: hypothetical protein F6K30_21975, partial [Cyanothece sp. SIO2G6]|nr:hypothetical protein [Cyanothece sp. SIO2G6]
VIDQVGLINAVDYARLSAEFEQIAQNSGCPYISNELVLRAGKTILCELRYGASVDINNLPETMVMQYMVEVLDANFIHAIPLVASNSDIDSSDFQQRISNIKGQVLEALDKWAGKVDADSSVKNLRMPNRQQLSEIDLEEDLLVGFT